MTYPVIFLGPTLSCKEARRILPHAYYFPPAQVGDVLRSVRLKPPLIAIIDGFFEKTRAVWHKEILYALHKGIPVWGASSMGALRARELHKWGMQGQGSIFKDYFTHLNTDDAVAVLHESAPYYTPMTESLVNITETLAYAAGLGVLSSFTKDKMITLAKNLFYVERTLETILLKARALALPEQEITSFHHWINKYGWVNTKKQDALILLKAIAEDVSSLPPAIPMHRSLFFRALHKSVMCTPFPYDHVCLPEKERRAFKIASNENCYRWIRRLAYLLSVTYTLGKKIQYERKDTFQLPIPASWSTAHSCVDTNLLQRITKIEGLWRNQQNAAHRYTWQNYVFALMRLSRDGEYQKYRLQSSMLIAFEEKEPIKYKLFEWNAKLWWLMESFVLNFIPNARAIERFSLHFRKSHKLFSSNAMEAWLLANDLDSLHFSDLMMRATRFQHIVLQNNLVVLGIQEEEEDIWWFGDALSVSGL